MKVNPGNCATYEIKGNLMRKLGHCKLKLVDYYNTNQIKVLQQQKVL